MKLNFSLLIVNFIIVACNNSPREETSIETLPAISIGKVQLQDLQGAIIDLKQYKGKVIFINFWATWCKPCREEMPSIQKAIEKLKEEQVEFFFASDEPTELIERFRAANEYDFNYVKVGNLSELNIVGLPTTFIFNPRGELIFSEMGYRKWDDKANIDLILNKGEPK